MRIQRALARAGVASRRGADALVAEGRVTINGQVAGVGAQVDPARDTIAVDGRPISAPRPHTWYVLHKPRGVMTTRRDPEGRQTVFDLVPDKPGLIYVGRLDYLTEGVLMLTTDGEAANVLTHPSHEVERTYVATVRGDVASAVRAALRGVDLGDGPVRVLSARAENVGGGRSNFEVTLAEGRKREVRRLCAAVGLEVDRLVRTRYGPIRLGTLPSGQWRELTHSERAAIDELVARGRAGRRLQR